MMIVNDISERLDVFLFNNGFCDSREKAKQLILENSVLVNKKIVSKPSYKVTTGSEVEIQNLNAKYVGRGALKLEKAINVFKILVENQVAIDIGASTGGFTDYLLKHGARKVYAVDVGHDQLHESLKINEKVINLENKNFRYINTKIFIEKADIVVVDVSFISLRLIMDKIVEISHEETDIVALVKPQFEAGKNNVGKNGIVRDKKIHLAVLNDFNECCSSYNLFIEDITYSPIKGGNGNIEYLAHLKRGAVSKFENEQFKRIIGDAFVLLK